jgi:phosphatidylglycerophosphatase A
MSEPSPSSPNTTTNSATGTPRSDRSNPRVSIAIATAFGLGYFPKAPGTFGSLAGIAAATFPFWLASLIRAISGSAEVGDTLVYVDPYVFLFSSMVLVALVGLWTANEAAHFWNIKDPQRVVIDEVSGQQIALLLGGHFFAHSTQPDRAGMMHSLANFSFFLSSNWKYLLMGFILFRVFDIWKPFPARQAESLPGGLGIMADDWVAGIYAALGLWIARALGL